MTPAARLAAAIEVFGNLESDRRPAADALKAWGLAHRFAGSGDRAAIAGLVYDALRRRASSAWIMGALALEHAEQNSARRVGAHQVGARRAPAQRVVNEPGDGGAVAGAGKAMRKAPALERVRRRAALTLKISENFDGGGKPRSRRHGRPSRMRIMKMTHIMMSTSAPTT